MGIATCLLSPAPAKTATRAGRPRLPPALCAAPAQSSALAQHAFPSRRWQGSSPEISTHSFRPQPVQPDALILKFVDSIPTVPKLVSGSQVTWAVEIF